MRDTRARGSSSRPRTSAPVASAPPRSRPTGPGPAGRRGPTTRTSAPRPRGRFTGRAVVLAVVLLALALSYVFPVRVYLAQQAEISELRASQAAQRAYVEDLERQAALWRDEDFIRIQARKRLYYGEPGEILFIASWEDEQPPPDAGSDPEDVPPSPDPWWDTLWASVRTANGE
jgi:cell division protein FtsB